MPDVGGRPVATIGPGDLLGVREGPVEVWRSIPYARPPVGELRFRAPQPAPAWSGLRDAAPRAPAAIQPPVLLSGSRLRTSEDCLYLNVTTPTYLPTYLPTDRPAALPVIVWLHGGGFRIGAGDDAIDSGRSLAATGQVVVVSLNYRLGALGFLHLGEQAPDAANCGILDQIAALEWVQQNIASFGGDPDQVTVFGASAGAKSLGTLLALPRPVALIRRAISMSGGADFTNDLDEASELSARFARSLGLTSPDVDALRAVPAAAILAAQERLAGGVASTWTWRPTVDGRLLTRDPLTAIGAGSARCVDLLAGTVANEARTFTTHHPGVVAVAPSMAEHVFGARHHEVLQAYSAAAGGDDHLAAEWFMTSERYRIPTIRLVEAQQRHAPVRMYRFGSPAAGPLPLGHGSDASLIWSEASDTADTAGTERDAADVRALARSMQHAWITFARTGIPVGEALPPWPVYDLDDRLTMLLDVPPTVAADPDWAERERWTGVRWRPGNWAG